jgi:biopolymer transport protein ExbD
MDSMKRKRFSVDIKKKQSFGLNITSMTDMFTILLVFLLQTYSTNEVQVDSVEGLRLPTSEIDRNLVDGVKISLSPTELLFDRTKIANVLNNKIEASMIDPNDSNFIKPLFDELQKFNKANEKSVKIGKVLFQADQNLPYSVVRKVMYTASMAGFPNLKMVALAVGN